MMHLYNAIAVVHLRYSTLIYYMLQFPWTMANGHEACDRSPVCMRHSRDISVTLQTLKQ